MNNISCDYILVANCWWGEGVYEMAFGVGSTLEAVEWIETFERESDFLCEQDEYADDYEDNCKKYFNNNIRYFNKKTGEYSVDIQFTNLGDISIYMDAENTVTGIFLENEINDIDGCATFVKQWRYDGEWHEIDD